VRRARRDLERDDPPPIRLSPRRVVFEVLVVGLSLAGAWLLRERGLSDVQPTDGTVRSGFDPFLAAAPLLVGLAVGLVIIRLYPIPVRVIGWLTGLRRDLVPVLGLRSIGRHPSAGYLPLLILTVTMAIGTLSAVLEASLVRSQVDVSWHDVGADYRVEAATGAALDPRLDVKSITGVQAAADGLVVADASMASGPGLRATVVVEAVDPDGYDAVLAGSPVERSLSATLGGWPTGPDAGTSRAPIPAIVSDQLPANASAVATGDVLSILIRGKSLRFKVVGRASDFPGVRPGGSFVITSLPSVVAGWGESPPRPSVVFARGDASVGAPIQAAIAESADTVVVSRQVRFAALHDTPLVAAISGGFLVAVGVAAAYAALAVVTVAALEADRRSREIAFLRTLGLTDRQVSQLTVIEQGAPVVIALVAGIALGLGLAWLVEPGLDLSSFSGTAVAVGLDLDWPRIAAIAVAIVAVVAAAVAGSSWAARRLDVGHALRIGED
jgi:putative ABC transport system permease protein